MRETRSDSDRQETRVEIALNLEGEAAAGAEAEAKLVRAAQAGSSAAFANLHARFAPMVHAVLLSRVPAGEAEDLLQDVFLKALKRIKALRPAPQEGADE